MKKTILVATGFALAVAFTSVGANAQSTGPAGQDTATKSDTMSSPMGAQAKMSKKKMMMMKKKKMMMKKDM